MLDKLKALFAAPAPTLQVARASLEETRVALDSVAALFAAAGLNLEQMLAAGPDSLKAHLASLDQSEAITQLTTKLATAEAGVTDLTAKLATAQSDHDVTRAALQVHADLLASTGFKAEATAKPEAVVAAFKAHVEHQAAALLARDGRPAVDLITREDAKAAPVAKTDAEHLAAYEALDPQSQARMDYAAKNFDAINRALRARPPSPA